VGDDDDGWEVCLVRKHAPQPLSHLDIQASDFGTGCLAIVYQCQPHGRITLTLRRRRDLLPPLLWREEASVPLSKEEKAVEIAASARIVVDLASRSASAVLAVLVQQKEVLVGNILVADDERSIANSSTSLCAAKATASKP